MQKKCNLKSLANLFLISTLLSSFFLVILLYLAGVFSNELVSVAFDETYYDAGTIVDESQKAVKHAFEIRNNGKKQLVIHKIMSSCGCTVPDKSEIILAPDEITTLKVELLFGSAGKRSGEIVLFSNAPSSPHKLVLEGSYSPNNFINLFPEKISVENIVKGTTEKQKFMVMCFHKQPEEISIKNIASEKHSLNISLQNKNCTSIKNQWGYYRTTFEIEVLLDTSKLLSFQDQIHISFDRDIFDSLSIPITWKVIDQWRVTPRQVYFFINRNSKNKVTKEIKLSHYRNEYFKLVEYVNDYDQFIKTTVEDFTTGIIVKLCMDPDLITSDFKKDSLLRLSLKSADKEDSDVIEIPIAIRQLGDTFSISENNVEIEP